MKNVTNQSGKQTGRKVGGKNIQYNVHKNQPEIRDDLDSRENEEQNYKSDDVTHNQKPHRSRKHTTGE
jgi:hypothetical protein